MADTVATHVLSNTDNYYVAHFTNYSDGTGETASTVKIDKSALTTIINGVATEPVSLDIVAVRWNVQGFTSVRVQWDHTTDVDALVLSGSGQDVFQYTEALPHYNSENGISDPRTAGGTGDIHFVTTGGTAGNSYDITLVCRKRKT